MSSIRLRTTYCFGGLMNFSKCLKSQFWNGILICIHHYEFMSGIFLKAWAKGDDGTSGHSPELSAKWQGHNYRSIEITFDSCRVLLGYYKANSQWNNRRNIQLRDNTLSLIYLFCDFYIFPKTRLSNCPQSKNKQTNISPYDLGRYLKHKTWIKV